MNRKIALLLALAFALGAALAEELGKQTVITVMEGLEIAVPQMPEIVVPEVPKESETKAPKLEVPEIPEIKIPQVETGLGLTDPIATPTATPAPQPEASQPPFAFIGADEAQVEAALDALGEPAYRAAYEALRAGEVLQRGAKGETARGVQLTLIALGQSIAADGDVGPRTLAALNAVQKAFGLEQTQTLDAEGYGELLVRLAEAG